MTGIEDLVLADQWTVELYVQRRASPSAVERARAEVGRQLRECVDEIEVHPSVVAIAS